MLISPLFKKIVILVMVIVVGLSLFGLWFTDSSIFESEEFKAERKIVTQHLKEKYGQEFVVKKVEHYTAYLGDKEQIRTHVVSKDEQPIEFIVLRYVGEAEYTYRETNLFDGYKEGYQSYLDLKWQQETGARFKNVAEQIFSRPVFLYTDLRMPSSYQYQNFGTTPSYFETLHTNPGIFVDKFTRQSMGIVFFYDINDSNKNEEKEKIYHFIKEIEKVGVQEFAIGIVYFSPEFEKDASQIINSVGMETFMAVEVGQIRSRQYQKRGKIVNEFHLPDKDFKNMKDSADILKYFRKR